MKFEKKHLRDLHRCYATGSIKIDDESHIVIFGIIQEVQCAQYKFLVKMETF